MKTRRLLPALAGVLLAAACGSDEGHEVASEPVEPEGTEFVVRVAERATTLEAAGVAEPWAEATLSTKLMGAVLEVPVREGDAVRAGDVVVRIDARDLDAKAAQVNATLAQAEAAYREAEAHVERMRALYADEAAPKAQLDAAEAGYARAEAAVRAARAGGDELAAMRSYATVRAPFDGTVTARFVEPGAFAAPGAPLVTIQTASRLRVSASVAPSDARGVSRGDTLQATIEGVQATAVVEGVVPGAGGNLYTVNAIVDNRDGRFLAGSAASLALPRGTAPSIVVPATALVREGDLTGVHMRGAGIRWVRVGRTVADSVEVLSGLRDGDRIVVPAAIAEGR